MAGSNPVIEPLRSSNLFQTHITMSDVTTFKMISTQAPVEAKNCGLAVANFLGFLPRYAVEFLSSNNTPSSMDEWRDTVSSLIKFAGGKTDVNIESKELSMFNLIKYVGLKLLPGYGTMILVAQAHGKPGHYFVIAKEPSGQVGVYDPQVGVCPEGGLIPIVGWDNIMNYIGSVIPENKVVMEHHLALPPSRDVLDIVARNRLEFSTWGYGELTPRIVQPLGLTFFVLTMNRELSSVGLKRMTDALRAKAEEWDAQRRLEEDAAGIHGPEAAAAARKKFLEKSVVYDSAGSGAAAAAAAAEARARDEARTDAEKEAAAAAEAAAARVHSQEMGGHGGAIRGRLPPSSPRRKAGRSSFGRLRRYTRRRRASRSGRVGYRPKGKSRRA